MRVRLLRNCRGYRKGETIEVSQTLADSLVASGMAERDNQASLIEPRRIERAVIDQAERQAVIE